MKDYFTGQNISDKESDMQDKLMFGLNQLTYFGGLAIGIGGIRKLYASANQKTQEYVKNAVKEHTESLKINTTSFFEKIAMANKQSDISKKMAENYTDTLTTSGIEKELNQIKKQIEHEVEKNPGLNEIEKQGMVNELYEKESRQYLALKNLSTNTAKEYLSASGLKYIDPSDADRFALDIYQEGQTNKTNLNPYQRKIIRTLKESNMFEIKVNKNANGSVDLDLKEVTTGKPLKMNLPKGFYTKDLLGTVTDSLDNNTAVLKVPDGKIINPFFDMDSGKKVLSFDIVANNGNFYSIDTATSLELHLKKLIKDGYDADQIVEKFNAAKQQLVKTASAEFGQPATLTIGVDNFNQYVEKGKTFGGATQENSLQTNPFDENKTDLKTKKINTSTAEDIRKLRDFAGIHPEKKIIDLGAFNRFKVLLNKIAKNPNHELHTAASAYLRDIYEPTGWDDIRKHMKDLDNLYTKSEKNPEYKKIVNLFERREIKKAGTGGYHSTLAPGEAFITVGDIMFDTASSSNIAVDGLTHQYQMSDYNRQNIYESLNAAKASGIPAMTINSEGKLVELAQRMEMKLVSSKFGDNLGIGQSGATIIPPVSGSKFLHRITQKFNSKVEIFRDPLDKKNLTITIHNAIKQDNIILTGDNARDFWRNFIKENRAAKRNTAVKNHLKINHHEAIVTQNFGRVKVEKDRIIYENGKLAFKKALGTITFSKDNTIGAKSNATEMSQETANETGLKPYINQDTDLYTVIRNMSDDLDKKTATSTEFAIYEDMVNKSFKRLVEHKKKMSNTTELSVKEINRLKHRVNYRTLAAFYGNKNNLDFNAINNIMKGGKLYKKENRAILRPLVTGLKAARKHIRDLGIRLDDKIDIAKRQYLEVMTGGVSKAEYGKFDIGHGNLNTDLSQPSMFYSQEKMFETLPDGTQKLKINPNDSFLLRDNHLSTVFGITEDNQYKTVSMLGTDVLEALEDRRRFDNITSFNMVKTHGFEGSKPTLYSQFFISVEATAHMSDFTLGNQFDRVKMNSREMLLLKLSNPYYYDLVSYQMENRNNWFVNHMKYLKSSLDVFDSRRKYANDELVKINDKPLETYRKSGKKNMFLYNDLLQVENIVKRSAEQTGREFFNLKQIIRQTVETSKKLSTLNTGDKEYGDVKKIHENLLTRLKSTSPYGVNEIFEVQARELVDIVNGSTGLNKGESRVLDLEHFFGYQIDALKSNGKIVIQGIDLKELSESISGKVTIDGKVHNTMRIDPDSSINIVTKLFSAREAIKEIKQLQQADKNKKNPIYSKMISSVEESVGSLLAEHRNYIERNSITDGSMLQKKAHQFSIDGMSATVKSNAISNAIPNALVMNEETFLRQSLGDKVYNEAQDLLKYEKFKSDEQTIRQDLASGKHERLKKYIDDPDRRNRYDYVLDRYKQKLYKESKSLNRNSAEYSNIITKINEIESQRKIIKTYKVNKDVIEYFKNESWEATRVKNAESLEAYKSAVELAEQIKSGRKYYVNTLRHPTMSELNMTDLYVSLHEGVTTGDVLSSQVDIARRLQGDQDKDRLTVITKGLRNILTNQMGIPSFERAIQEVTADIYGLRNSLFQVTNTTDNPQSFNLKALNYNSEKQMSYIIDKNNNGKLLVLNNVNNIIEEQVNFVSKRFNLSRQDQSKLHEHMKANADELLFNGKKITGDVFFFEKNILDQTQIEDAVRSSAKDGFIIARTPGALGLETNTFTKPILNVEFTGEFGLDADTRRKRKLAGELKEQYHQNWKKLVENIDTQTTDLVSKYTKSLTTGVSLQKQDAPTLYKTNTIMSLALSYVKKGVDYADHHRDVFNNIDTFLRDFTTAYGEVPLQSKHGTPSIVEGLQKTLTTVLKGGKSGEAAALQLANNDFTVHVNPEERIFFNKTKNSTNIGYRAYKEGIRSQSNMFMEMFNKVSKTNTFSMDNGTINLTGNINEAIRSLNINAAANSSSFATYEQYLKSVAEQIQDHGAQQNLVGHMRAFGSKRQGNLGEFLYAGIIQSQKKLEGMSKFESAVGMSDELAKKFHGSVSALYTSDDTKMFMQGIEQGYDFVKGQHLTGQKISLSKIKHLYDNLRNNEFRAGFAQISLLSEQNLEQIAQNKGKARRTITRTPVPEAQNINFAEVTHMSGTISNFKGIGKSALVGTLIGMGINQIMSGFSVPDLASDRGVGGEYWENKATKNSEKMLKPGPPRVEKVNPATRDSVLDVYRLRQVQASGNNFYKDRSLIEKNNVHQETLGVRIR